MKQGWEGFVQGILKSQYSEPGILSSSSKTTKKGTSRRNKNLWVWISWRRRNSRQWQRRQQPQRRRRWEAQACNSSAFGEEKRGIGSQGFNGSREMRMKGNTEWMNQWIFFYFPHKSNHNTLFTTHYHSHYWTDFESSSDGINIYMKLFQLKFIPFHNLFLSYKLIPFCLVLTNSTYLY